jgi:hypothetical protein
MDTIPSPTNTQEMSEHQTAKRVSTALKFTVFYTQRKMLNLISNLKQKLLTEF